MAALSPARLRPHAWASHPAGVPRLAAPDPGAGRFSGLSTDLAIVALSAAMLPRLLTAAGVPALVNFLHFPIVLGAALLVAPGVRRRISKRLFAGVYALFGAIAASALLNGAGLVNAILDFVLLSEPFLFLFVMTAGTMSAPQLSRFRLALVGVTFLHVALAYHQYFVQGRWGDGVQGLFVGQGAGAHVAGAVALSAAAYLAVALPGASLPARIVLGLTCAAVAVFSDSKQVLLVFVASLATLSILQVKPARVLRYFTLSGGACVALVIVSHTVLPQLVLRRDPAQVAEGLQHKSSIFVLLTQNFRSPGNWLLGLGPGHTVGRFGELVPKYRSQLVPLGVTTSAVTRQAIALKESHHLSRTNLGSSLWSPIFFWAGAFGDLGLTGVAVLVGLWLLVWRSFCHHDLARFLVLNMFFFGATFAWLEEPGYMLFAVALIALLWQQRHQPSRPERGACASLGDAQQQPLRHRREMMQ